MVLHGNIVKLFPINTTHLSFSAFLLIHSCGDLRALIDQQPMLPLPPLSNISNITTSEIESLKKMEMSLFSRLTTRRDRRMTKKLSAFLQANRTGTAFIAVGAGNVCVNVHIQQRLYHALNM